MDIEKAKELHSSPYWELVIREIDENKIKPLMEKLRNCTPVELEGVQTRLKVWEEAKRLPQDAIEREE